MKTVVSAHQPNFLPYLGFFDKMRQSDVFVIRDEVQFVERDYHHRNRIRIDGFCSGEPQSKWIRVPVNKEMKEIRDIRIKKSVKDKSVPWNIFMLRQIRANYQKAPFFRKYYPDLEAILLTEREKLVTLNMEIIEFIRGCLNIDTQIVYASELKCGKTHDASEDLIRIAQAINADVYLSGRGGAAYMKEDLFQKAGIELQYQKFAHPVYRQRYPGFVRNLASIDALFNVGNIFYETHTGERELEAANRAIHMEVAGRFAV